MSQTNEESGTDLSPTRQFIFSAKLRSPTVTSSFSPADTILTSRTHYNANTGGRARQSWRNSMNGFWHTPRSLADENKESTTHRSDSVADNSTDEAVSPKPGAPSGVPAIELPASPLASPDEPRSFFDSDSESDGEPILSRASSVRAQKPQLVQHNSNGSGRSLCVYGIPPAPSTSHGLPLSMAQQVLGSSPNTLHSLTPQAQRASPNDTRPGPSISKAQQLLGIPLKNLAYLKPAAEEEISVESPGGPAEALEALMATALDGTSTTPLAPAHSSKSGLSQTRNYITEMANIPARTEALSTIPSLMSGFSNLGVPQHHVPEQAITVDYPTEDSFCQPQASATDNLRSNPVRDYDNFRLNRAISAPPLPFRHPHRKVTIRPLDLEAAGEHRLRQSVVSTPYPTRASSFAVDAISPLSAVTSTKVSLTLPPTSEEHDRFPSPARPEVLYLKFAVARHPTMNTIVQIKIEDRSTYDDEALFKVLRKSCNQTLSGLAQYLVTARALQGVTSTDPMFETASFLRHLRSPRAGRKRKTWLIWLREHQVKRNASSSNGSDKIASFSPPTSTPRMPFFKTQKTYPQLTFHFEFSLIRITLVVTGIMMSSGLAAIFWVLFGVPGVRPGHGHNDLVVPVENWEGDAQGRVLTGLVLGVFVALLGTLGVAGWIAASWLLL
jgi:hypothetical protein